MSRAGYHSERRLTTGDLIRRSRDDRGWTQAELARRMGAEPHEVASLVRSISRWEAGAEPKRHALRRVAAAFQVPVFVLLGDDEDDPTVEVPADLMEQLAAARAELALANRALALALRWVGLRTATNGDARPLAAAGVGDEADVTLDGSAS